MNKEKPIVPKVEPEKEMTVVEKLTRDLRIKEQEFKQAKANLQRIKSTLADLKVEFEKAEHTIMKVASAYKALNDFKESLEPTKKTKPVKK